MDPKKPRKPQYPASYSQQGYYQAGNTSSTSLPPGAPQSQYPTSSSSQQLPQPIYYPNAMAQNAFVSNPLAYYNPATGPQAYPYPGSVPPGPMSQFPGAAAHGTPYSPSSHLGYPDSGAGGFPGPPPSSNIPPRQPLYPHQIPHTPDSRAPHTLQDEIYVAEQLAHMQLHPGNSAMPSTTPPEAYYGQPGTINQGQINDVRYAQTNVRNSPGQHAPPLMRSASGESQFPISRTSSMTNYDNQLGQSANSQQLRYSPQHMSGHAALPTIPPFMGLGPARGGPEHSRDNVHGTNPSTYAPEETRETYAVGDASHRRRTNETSSSRRDEAVHTLPTSARVASSSTRGGRGSHAQTSARAAPSSQAEGKGRQEREASALAAASSSVAKGKERQDPRQQASYIPLAVSRGPSMPQSSAVVPEVVHRAASESSARSGTADGWGKSNAQESATVLPSSSGAPRGSRRPAPPSSFPSQSFGTAPDAAPEVTLTRPSGSFDQQRPQIVRIDLANVQSLRATDIPHPEWIAEKEDWEHGGPWPQCTQPTLRGDWRREFRLRDVARIAVRAKRFVPASQNTSNSGSGNDQSGNTPGPTVGQGTSFQRSEKQVAATGSGLLSQMTHSSSQQLPPPEGPGKPRPGFVTWHYLNQQVSLVAPMLTSKWDRSKWKPNKYSQISEPKYVHDLSLLDHQRRQWWVPVDWRRHKSMRDDEAPLPLAPPHPQGLPSVPVDCYQWHPGHPYKRCYVWAGDPGQWLHQKGLNAKGVDRIVPQYCRLTEEGYKKLQSRWNTIWYAGLRLQPLTSPEDLS